MVLCSKKNYQLSLAFSTEQKQPFIFTTALSPTASCLFMQIIKKARENYQTEHRTLATVKHDIWKLMPSLLTAEELQTELLTRHTSLTSHSCCEMLHCLVFFSAFLPFYSSPIYLLDLHDCQTLLGFFVWLVFIVVLVFCGLFGLVLVCFLGLFVLWSPLNSSCLVFCIPLAIVSD